MNENNTDIKLWHKAGMTSHENDSVICSDTMADENPDKFEKACRQVWGHTDTFFSNRSPEDIQAFLSAYLGKPVMLIMLRQHRNIELGKPYWSFTYTDA